PNGLVQNQNVHLCLGSNHTPRPSPQTRPALVSGDFPDESLRLRSDPVAMDHRYLEVMENELRKALKKLIPDLKGVKVSNVVPGFRDHGWAIVTGYVETDDGP